MYIYHTRAHTHTLTYIQYITLQLYYTTLHYITLHTDIHVYIYIYTHST